MAGRYVHRYLCARLVSCHRYMSRVTAKIKLILLFFFLAQVLYTEKETSQQTPQSFSVRILWTHMSRVTVGFGFVERIDRIARHAIVLSERTDRSHAIVTTVLYTADKHNAVRLLCPVDGVIFRFS